MRDKPQTKFVELEEFERDSLLMIIETFLLKNPFFCGRMKYEDALVAFIELFEQGYLKLWFDDDMTSLTLLLYDPALDDYVKPQDSSITRFLGRTDNGRDKGTTD